MGLMFKRAKGTVVYLGEEEDETSTAYKCLRHLNVFGRTLTEDQLTAARRHSAFVNLCQSLWIPWLGDRELHSIQMLVGRRWFTRAWVFQESALGRDKIIMVGSHGISQDDFVVATQTLVEIGRKQNCHQESHLPDKLLSPLRYATDTIEPQYLQRFSKETPAQYFWKTLLGNLCWRSLKNIKATDSRDLVYSHIGISFQNQIPLLDPTTRYHRMICVLQ